MGEDIDRLAEDIAGLLSELQRKRALERAKKRRADDLVMDQARLRRSKIEELPVYMLS